ncbi:MAG: hypothetical protein L3J12_11330, partial [Spirochaetales bacterium]|nr:hypothetical protein [Spirochaetales bacterium]
SKPMSENKSLAEADFLSEINSSDRSFSDFPLPGTLNYYAILDSELYKSGRFTIIPGGNSTIESSGVVTGDSEAYLESRKSIRNNPLPFLEINKSINTGKPLISQSTSLPVKQNLSFMTTTIINKLINSIYTERKELLTPVILSKDLETSENSEEYQLKKILLSDFKEKNWPVAYRLLSNFLSFRHSKYIELRAHFYRAQILFCQNKYRDSVMEFILADDELREEIKPWQDQILTILR